MIAPVQSLAHLRAMANRNPKYHQLAILTAYNLGYRPEESLDEAMTQLHNEANETSEDEVVEEANYCRTQMTE